MTLSNILKTAACASVLGIAAIAGSASSASAATYETRCYGDDCYRVRCDDFGFGCRRVEDLGAVGYTRYRDREVCDEDGDDCHWVRTRVPSDDYDDDTFGD